jgi:hypothetical protein
VSDLKAQLHQEGSAAEDARRAAEASASEAAAARATAATEVAAWQAKMAERKKVRRGMILFSLRASACVLIVARTHHKTCSNQNTTCQENATNHQTQEHEEALAELKGQLDAAYQDLNDMAFQAVRGPRHLHVTGRSAHTVCFSVSLQTL